MLFALQVLQFVSQVTQLLPDRTKGDKQEVQFVPVTSHYLQLESHLVQTLFNK